MTKAYRLLGILQEYAPDAVAQEKCSTMYCRAYLNGATQREMEQMLIGAMADGLKYGNWPWTVLGEDS